MPINPNARVSYKAIGDRRHQVALQRVVGTTDTLGGTAVTDWSTYATEWAAVTEVPVVVSEQDATVLFVLEIPYRSDVLVQHRAVVDSVKTLKIIAVVDQEFKHRGLQLHCASV